MVEEAEVVEGARAIGFTLGTPGLSMLGVVDDLLVDRAFIEQRRDSALELAKIADIHPAAPHNVANALAAAALARSYGVPATAVRDGLRNVRLGAHKIELVAEHGGVRSSTTPRPPTRTPGRLRRCGPSTPGRLDRRRPGQGHHVRRSRDAPIGQAARRGAARRRSRADRRRARPTRARGARHRHRSDGETRAMRQAVEAAASLARPGDVVLLAPGLRQSGHVLRVCRPWRRVRRGGARPPPVTWLDAVRRRAGGSRRGNSDPARLGGRSLRSRDPLARASQAVSGRRRVSTWIRERCWTVPLTSYHLVLGAAGLLLGARHADGAVRLQRAPPTSTTTTPTSTSSVRLSSSSSALRRSW